MECKCEKAKKIQPIERKFIYDQRTTRIGCIGSLDRKVRVKLKKRIAINCCARLWHGSYSLSSVPPTSQMRLKSMSTALVSDRFGVGMISVKDSSLMIDKSKIRKEKTEDTRSRSTRDASAYSNKGNRF